MAALPFVLSILINTILDFRAADVFFLDGTREWTVMGVGSLARIAMINIGDARALCSSKPAEGCTGVSAMDRSVYSATGLPSHQVKRD
jgi:hypothetical protein